MNSWNATPVRLPITMHYACEDCHALYWGNPGESCPDCQRSPEIGPRS